MGQHNEADLCLRLSCLRTTTTPAPASAASFLHQCSGPLSATSSRVIPLNGDSYECDWTHLGMALY